MGASSTPAAVVELSEGLSLVPCTIISLSFTRADVSVKPVDEWQLKEALTAFFKKRLGLAVSDRDLVVHREKNYYKKRRDEPIADGVLHLWGGQAEGGNRRVWEREDPGKYVVESVNGVELNVAGLKLRCLAVIKETNSFEAIKLSWEAVFGPRRGGVSQAGPTTLILKGVPSRWFAEPRVSSKASVLVTHTIFSNFGEIRNLEVLGNEDLGKNLKEVGSVAAALQCQVWVQFDNHVSFCNALHALCGRAMQKAGSNFRATYVVDWDKENYFSVLNVRRRKFERLEHQERIEAERAQKQELEARKFEKERLEQQERTEAERALEQEAKQAELAHAEQEKLEMEQMAAALREEEERELQLAEQTLALEAGARKHVPESDSESASSEEEGLIQDERQESSDSEIPQHWREDGPISKDEKERGSLQAREKRRYSSEDEEERRGSPQVREMRRYTSEDEEETPSPQAGDKRRYMPMDKEERRSLQVQDKRRDTSEDEEERRLPQVREKRRYTSEDVEERRLLQLREKRRYTSEDEEERRLPQVRGKGEYTSEEEGYIRGGSVHKERPDRELSSSLERWQPGEETEYYPTLELPSRRREEEIYHPNEEERVAVRKRSHSSDDDSMEEDKSGDDTEDRRVEEPEQGGTGDFEVERWVLEVTHSVASLSASEMLSRAAMSVRNGGGMARAESSEKRLRSVVLISS